jgi:hypothetical protein
MRTASHRIVPLDIDSLRPLHIARAMGHRTVPGILGLASILFLAACGGSGGSTGLTSTALTIAPQPASVPVNSTVTFTATDSLPSNERYVTWSIICGGGTGGTLSSQTGGAPTITYTAPATPPVYAAPCNGIPGGGDGEVVLQATDTGGIIAASTGTVTFPITAPTVTVGLGPPTATVKLGATEQFAGYAIGNVNNALTWQVNGVIGGSAATGTITSAVTTNYQGGLYTAPAAMPMSGNTVTITMISQADPTKTRTAIVTLQ